MLKISTMQAGKYEHVVIHSCKFLSAMFSHFTQGSYDKALKMFVYYIVKNVVMLFKDS